MGRGAHDAVHRTLICALFGFIWDVSLHIGKGRDPGPLANPAHYFILVGLFLLFVAGCAAIVLPYEKPGPFAVRITKNWYAPVSGFLMAGCGLYALTGFPLDDVWHRIFGQDVTLWGPTHLMMIGGAGFSTISALLLDYEGDRAMGNDKPKDGVFLKGVKYLGFGGIIIGLSVFQIEFDFGVPQFRQVFEPMLIAAAGAFGLVAARMMLGRFAAILAALFAIALRGLVALIVGPVLGAPINWFALYLGAAVVIELVALTPVFKRPIVFGLVSGLLVSTVGLWLESFWIDAVYHYPWPSSIWPEALMMAVPVTVLTGACGAMLGMVLTGQRLPTRAISIGLVALTVLVIGGATANGLRYEVPQNATATMTLTEVPGSADRRMVTADVRINPPDLLTDDPNWVSVLGWQGGLANDRGIFIDHLEKLGPGHYRSTQPMPAWGSWKTLLRVHDGGIFTAAPIFLAGDPGIGAPEVPAAGVDDAAVRRRDHHPAARAQPRYAHGAVDRRRPGGTDLHADHDRRSHLGRGPYQPARAHRHEDGAAAIGAGIRQGPVASDVSILADHSLLLAIPAFVPAFVVAGVVVYIAMKDRRNRDGPHSEEPGFTDQDE